MLKTVEELIVEKHTQNLRAGFQSWSHSEASAPPALGDYRWTDELILATWMMAETGRPPENGLEYKVGNSDGGFDLLRKCLPGPFGGGEFGRFNRLRLNLPELSENFFWDGLRLEEQRDLVPQPGG